MIVLLVCDSLKAEWHRLKSYLNRVDMRVHNNIMGFGSFQRIKSCNPQNILEICKCKISHALNFKSRCFLGSWQQTKNRYFYCILLLISKIFLVLQGSLPILVCVFDMLLFPSIFFLFLHLFSQKSFRYKVFFFFLKLKVFHTFKDLNTYSTRGTLYFLGLSFPRFCCYPKKCNSLPVVNPYCFQP